MFALLRRAFALALLLVPIVAVAAPCAGFNDVEDTDPFCPNVVWIKNRSITLGCTAVLYCPTAPVTRLAMAAFLNRLGNVLLPPNVIWVANEGGQFQSIQAAIDYAAAVPFQYTVVKVAPGWYAEQVNVPANVVVEGSGRTLTEIRSQGGCSAGVPTAGGVTLNGNAQLRHIHVSLTSTGTVGECAAVVIANGSAAALDDVLVRISGESGVQHAIRVAMSGSDHPVVIENVEVRASTAFASAATLIGVSASGSALDRLILRNMDISGSGPIVTGIRLSDLGARIERVTVAASGFAPSPTLTALALANNALASNDVLVQSSALRTITGGAAATKTGGGTLRIASSLLEGSTSGSMSCFGNYDSAMSPVAC